MYDVIILGLGSMGSSTLYQLAKQGAKVLGIEQFGIGHDKGSHSGQTRIVRKAYFEHPDYVPLLERAYSGWEAIQEASGKELFYKTGLAYFGERNHPVMEGVHNASASYGIDLKVIENDQSAMFSVPSDYKRIIEPDAGFALSEETIRTYVEEAIKHEAEIRMDEVVQGWQLKNGLIEVFTNKTTYKAERLVITAGAYTKQVLPQLSHRLNVTKQMVSWIKPRHSERVRIGKLPCWVLADQDYPGIMYGFPILPQEKYGGNGLLKVAHHYPGEIITPEQQDEFDIEAEKLKITGFLKKYMPEVLGEVVSMNSCLYTNTPDEHFILDYLPDTNKQVVIACGFSGHGFKFVPVVGEVLADLALKGGTEWPIDFLKLNRC